MTENRPGSLEWRNEAGTTAAERVRRLHRPVTVDTSVGTRPEYTSCAACYLTWPCDVAAALDGAEAEARRLREAATVVLAELYCSCLEEYRQGSYPDPSCAYHFVGVAEVAALRAAVGEEVQG